MNSICTIRGGAHVAHVSDQIVEAIIEKVKQDLNLEDRADDYTPIICGSVVAGGFKRKLQMLRADLFAMLSVC